MKFIHFCFAMIIVAFAGTGIAQAAPDRNAESSMHYSYVQWAYFSDGGFSSHPESYGGQAMEAGEVSMMPGPVGSVTGHSYTIPEYLYFSGKGFAPGNN